MIILYKSFLETREKDLFVISAIFLSEIIDNKSDLYRLILQLKSHLVLKTYLHPIFLKPLYILISSQTLFFS
jgi:hypothetical protein